METLDSSDHRRRHNVESDIVLAEKAAYMLGNGED